MSSGSGVLRIGEVHAQLRREFPDIELSKIRYYEEKGLVLPARSRKGYRLYSERDVACLREAIRLAQEEFVPLKVVRLRLIEQGLLRDESPSGLSTTPRRAARELATSTVSIPAPTTSSAPTRATLHVVTPEPTRDAHEAPVKEFFDVEEILSISGLTPESLNQLLAIGLIVPERRSGETLYRAIDLRVCAQARALLERGVDVRLLGALRRVVEREVGIIDDLTAPLRQAGSGVSNERAETLCRDIAHEVSALRGVLSERAVSDYLGS
ncbi:MAG: hypothetical protein B7X07_03460 [Actinobacteria bacterium 21-64-8]|nr:MAG: hypothetical protein B7X07_03460 [Actinobacteria bacterium 21-64-8]